MRASRAGRILKDHRWVFLLALVAFTVRFFIFLLLRDNPTGFLEPDSRLYLDLARDFPHSYTDPSSPLYDGSFLRPPGFPWFLSLGGLSDNLQQFIFINILLGTFTSVLTYAVALQLVDRRAALIAGGVVAIDPASVLYSTRVLTESLFTLLILVAVAGFLQMLRRPALWQAALTGLVLAAAAFVRPIALLLPAVLALLALFLVRASRLRRVVLVVVLAASFGIPTGAWVARNYVATGEVAFGSPASIILLYYRAAGALAETEGLSFSEAQARVKELFHERLSEAGLSPEEQARLTPLEIDAREAALAREIIRAHLWGAVQSSVAGAVALLIGPGLLSIQQTLDAVGLNDRAGWIHSSIVVFQLLLLGGLYASAATGLLLARRDVQSRRAVVALALVVAYFVVLSAGPEAFSRFRVPIVPLIAILSGYGFSKLSQRNGAATRALLGKGWPDHYRYRRARLHRRGRGNDQTQWDPGEAHDDGNGGPLLDPAPR